MVKLSGPYRGKPDIIVNLAWPFDWIWYQLRNKLPRILVMDFLDQII